MLEISLFAGLIAAVVHVITGPDHLAAVLPFIVESKRKAWKIGLFWALGHIIGMALIGILYLLFKELIPVDSISSYSEQLVGIVLIAIGIWSIYKVFNKNKSHKHLHIHAKDYPVIHSHEHTHQNEKDHTHDHSKTLKQNYWTSTSIGVLHGFAGIAHFLIFLPVFGFDSNFQSSMYIFGFILGTLTAMILFAFVIGRVTTLARNDHNKSFYNGIRFAAGIIAIIIGLYWFFAN